MSWRTRGIYRGLSEGDHSFLERFNQAWETKAEGRDQTDAMEWRVSESLPIIPASDIQFNGERDANFILAMTAIHCFTPPKRASNNGWRIRITLKSGGRFMIHFDSIDSATHLYSELLEFRQWFQTT